MYANCTSCEQRCYRHEIFLACGMSNYPPGMEWRNGAPIQKVSDPVEFCGWHALIGISRAYSVIAPRGPAKRHGIFYTYLRIKCSM